MEVLAKSFAHDHSFNNGERTRGERRTRWVVALTIVMMGAELVGGTIFGSMALLADGWHMGTHAAAMGAALFAYAFARRHAKDPRFSFGTGKVFSLAGFGSAVGLGVVALLVFGESMVRFVSPHPIRFGEAIVVAGLGLGVNLLSAWLLAEEDPSQGGHAHGGHSHGHGHHQDHNLRAAYLHVLADALTSVLAIAALVAGKYWGWLWMDPAMGLVGAVLIASWSYGLMRDTSRVLLDAEDHSVQSRSIMETIEGQGEDRVSDLHLFRVGPQGLAAIVAVVTRSSRLPSDYKERLMQRSELSKLLHLTVEVNQIDRAGEMGRSVKR